MDPRTLELMEDHVRAIYRALTDKHLPAAEGAGTVEITEDQLAVDFAVLAAMARTIPSVAERVPPFSFAPALDVVSDDRELRIEVAVPGVTRADISIRRSEDFLVIDGVRRPSRVTNGSTYVHAEIPCGPFHRVVHLPGPVFSEPNIEIENGLIRIRLARTPSASQARA